LIKAILEQDSAILQDRFDKTMPSSKEERTEQLRQIKEDVINLKDSPLYEIRVKSGAHPVIGEGNHEAQIMFVGEAPGENEAKRGRPFCGAAGKVLDELLKYAGIERTLVYITNIVKDRPPQNRDPYPEEIAMYGPFLERQINIIQPRVIVALGRFSMQYLMEKLNIANELQSISKIHGRVFKGETSYGKVSFIPMFHPAMALYHEGSRGMMEKDFETLKQKDLFEP